MQIVRDIIPILQKLLQTYFSHTKGFGWEATKAVKTHWVKEKVKQKVASVDLCLRISKPPLAFTA